MVAALLAIALVAMLLHNRRLARHNAQLAAQVEALTHRVTAMQGILAKWERMFTDAAKICEWADTGKVPEKEWWE
jgi:Tfp pilus assembly protein PilV